jgi:type III secretion system low calcium response chaperone LcrH/SycD
MKLKALLSRLGVQAAQFENLEAYVEHFIPTRLAKSDTLQQAFAVTTYEMEEIYQEAYQLYDEDLYMEAADIFRWLVVFNPFVGKYWMGLAASLHVCGSYDKALHAYALSALLDSENPYPHYHAYECYLALNDKNEAEKALNLAYKRALVNNAYLDLQTEIKRLKTCLISR